MSVQPQSDLTSGFPPWAAVKNGHCGDILLSVPTPVICNLSCELLKLLRSDSHIHFPGLLVEGAQPRDVPAARGQEARGDGGDCRLHYRQKES